jgi:hypothetical protein
MHIALAVGSRDFPDFPELFRGNLAANHPQTEGKAVFLDLPHESAFFEGSVINIRHNISILIRYVC